MDKVSLILKHTEIIKKKTLGKSSSLIAEDTIKKKQKRKQKSSFLHEIYY